jgi:predicted oxidoreductase
MLDTGVSNSSANLASQGCKNMATKDFILQNLDQLPEDLWQEVLDFVLFLRHKQQIIEALEDAEDIADAQAALAEPGLIPLSEVKKGLGLH